MKQERNVVITIFILVAIFASISLVIRKTDGGIRSISPISETTDIFSFFRKKEKPKSIVYGYLPYWTINENKYFQYDLLSDIAYFGLRIDGKGEFIKIVDGEYEPGYNNWKNNEDLLDVIKKAKKNNVRFALTVIAHVDEDNDAFLNCRECWDSFADNLETELREKDIKDVNLNFEYVEYSEKESATKFVEFTDFINKRLDKTFGESFVVVSAFADSPVKDRVSSDILNLAKVSDGIFIMAYDFHRPNSDTTGPVSPIDGKGVHAEYDIRTMLKDYLAVAPPNKLILGVPYYGYNWVISENKEYAERLPGNDDIGYSQSQTYSAIMETVLDVKPYMNWDDLGKSPYFSYVSPSSGSLRQVYFDNDQSLKEKYKLVKDNNLGGIGIWALGYDGGYKELWNLIYTEFVR